MYIVDGQAAGGVTGMTSMEDGLRAALLETADEVAHAECFEPEQRAEVYTILKTLRTNTDTHRAMVELLSHKMRKEQGDA